VDRRGFLSVVGLGGVALVVPPPLLLQSPTIAVAEPHTRIFLPPEIGWPVWRSQETVADFLRRFHLARAERERRELGDDPWARRFADWESRGREFRRQSEAEHPWLATGPAEDTWRIEGFVDLAAPINLKPGQTLRFWTGWRPSWRFEGLPKDPAGRRRWQEKTAARWEALRALAEQYPKPGPAFPWMHGDLSGSLTPVEVIVTSVKVGLECERVLFDSPHNPKVDEWQSDARRVQITAVALHAGRPPFAFPSVFDGFSLKKVDGLAAVGRRQIQRREVGQFCALPRPQQMFAPSPASTTLA
jgi:hypothetical protein